MSAPKRFSATGKPNTCIWCGKPLRFERTYEFLTLTRPDGTTYNTISDKQVNRYEKPGWEGSGLFCRQMCAAQFGWLAAKSGVRFTLKDKSDG